MGKTDEWLTPPEVVDRVVELLGEIDLDPCAETDVNPNVPAKAHVTKKNDGLNQMWWGRVFMNPPYGRRIIEWVDHLLAEFRSDPTMEAIALLPAKTDTIYFKLLRDYPRCFVDHRLSFDGNGCGRCPFPSMIVYLGPRTEEFASIFSGLGDIYVLKEPEEEDADAG